MQGPGPNLGTCAAGRGLDTLSRSRDLGTLFMVSPKMSGDIGRVRKIGGRMSSFEVKSLNCQDSFGPVCAFLTEKGWVGRPLQPQSTYALYYFEPHGSEL